MCNQSLQIPVSARVIRTGSYNSKGDYEKVLYSPSPGEFIFEYVPTKSFECQSNFKINAKQFIVESTYILSVNKTDSKGSNLFKAFVLETEEILNRKAHYIKNSNLKKIQNEINVNTSKNKLNIPDAINARTKQIFNAFNPIMNDGKNSESTLFIPLSVDFFKKYPELCFPNVPCDQQLQNRIAGDSGEGIQDPRDLIDLKDELIRIRNKIQNSKNLELKNSPEAKFITEFNLNDFSKYKRAIFIHHQTYDSLPGNRWQSYINVDQSIGGLKSDPLTSVLVHETNVNSFGFLPNDTHQLPEDLGKLWACLDENPNAKVQSDELDRAIGIQKYLSLVQLRLILDQL